MAMINGKDRLNPFHHPGEKLFNIYKHKLEHQRQQNAILFLKIAVRVLRKHFGFSPEMVSEFTKEFEAELKKHDEK